MYSYVSNSIKRIQVELLDEIDRICQKHNIKYQLFAGTLLGAIRHQGFIPWDDDLDICMLREDYNKFVSVCEKELDSKYFLHLPNKDGLPFAFAKLRKNDTEMVEGYIAKENIHQGIYVDIFQMDNVMPKTFKGEIQRQRLNLLHRIRLAKINIRHRNPIVRFIKRIFNVIFIGNVSDYINKIDKLAIKYNKKETKYVASLTWAHTAKNYSGFLCEKADFDNHILTEFEGKKYPAPKRYHEILTSNYGDYMKFPPLSEQKSEHGISKISFDGENYDIYEEDNEIKAKRVE